MILPQPYYDDGKGIVIYHGGALSILQAMPDETVQCCVTSPPYFGLRDYGVDGQIGLESTPEAYVSKLVAVFREVRRVLNQDGTLWLNLGDSYAGSGKGRNGDGTHQEGGKQATSRGTIEGVLAKTGTGGLKPKDLIGIPWMVAFALRADGWYLRQDIIWAKPNPMPESVRDRCTKSHEYLFLLSKSERYYYDAGAIKEAGAGRIDVGDAPRGRLIEGGFKYSRTKRDSFKRNGSKREQAIPGQSVGTHRPNREESNFDITSRNKRSVWTVATRPYKEAHFATFPQKLIEPCILAGSRSGDVVLDPFLGSGTSLFVAKQLNRKAIGIELNAQYLPLSAKRLGQEVLPL